MKFEELRVQEFLQLDPENGLLRFAGERALLVNADAMGDLREELVEKFGFLAIQGVLTQFGFAQGWRLAAQMKEQFQWPTAEDWRSAGSHLGWISGLIQSHEGIGNALLKEGSELDHSYEAEQHLTHRGPATDAACWTVSGFMSGYLSRTEEADILVLEDKCVACGDISCRFVARPRAEWEAESLRLDPGKQKDLVDRLLDQKNEIPTRPTAPRKPGPKALAHRSLEIPEMATQSSLMRAAVDLAKRFAGVNSTIVITGESGTGKERMARFIHAHSDRASQPFVAINCGAINENLLESELFGHARGAFTGAVQARAGIFEAADHGTLLLDEIGEVSPAMQVKLLRVLQEQELQRVGESQTRTVDVRVLAATNSDLALLTKQGTFREDLYYRLHVLEVKIPPLRARREDILPLARTMVERSADRLKRSINGFSSAVAEQLLRYSWPGNVRELENAIERAVALSEGSHIELEDLPPQVLAGKAGSDPRDEKSRATMLEPS